MSVTYDEYKGNRMIVLRNSDQDKYPFQFGQKKAKLIMANIEAIREFAEMPEKPKP